jgi:hypothetical protein
MEEYKRFLSAKIEEYNKYKPYKMGNTYTIDELNKIHNIPNKLKEYLSIVSSVFFINDIPIHININEFPDYEKIKEFENKEINIRTPVLVFFNMIGNEEIYFDLLKFDVWSYNIKDYKFIKLDTLDNYIDRIIEDPQVKCVSCYSKTVFEYSRTRREPVYSKTVLPFLNSDAHKLYIINPDNSINWNNLRLLIIKKYGSIKEPYTTIPDIITDMTLRNYLLNVSSAIYIDHSIDVIEFNELSEYTPNKFNIRNRTSIAACDDLEDFENSLLKIGYVYGNPEGVKYNIYLDDNTIWEDSYDCFYLEYEDFRDYLEFFVIPRLLNPLKVFIR